MIIIDNVVNNAKLFLLTGSIAAFVNVLIIIVTIAVLCYYIKYYHVSNALCIDSEDIVLQLHEKVTKLAIYRSTVLLNFNMAASNTFSHWFIVATLENGYKVALSSARTSTIHVLDAKQFLKKLFKLKMLHEYAVAVPTTLDEIMNFEHKLIQNTTYDLVNFNCQDVVYHTIKRYCKSNLKRPLHGLKLCKVIYNEIFE